MNEVLRYVDVKSELMKEFGCQEDYFVKVLKENRWFVANADGFYKLSYFENLKGKEIKKETVVVEINNKPQIFRNEEYTMVIAIQCVKIAFVFKNTNEVC